MKSKKTEAKLKFLVDKKPQEICALTKVKETYLEMNSFSVRSKVKECLGDEATSFVTCYIKEVDEKEWFVVFETERNISATRFEEEITKDEATYLIRNSSIYKVFKTEYLVFKNEKFELVIEELHQNKLVAVARFDAGQYSVMDAKKFAASLILEFSNKVEDITNDPKFEDKNLAEILGSKKRLLVVNLFGGPCTGKSTLAAMTFAKLKVEGVNCEIVTEYPKEIVYSGGKHISNQLTILGEQFRRQNILEDNVDVAVTDSPLLLSAIYSKLNGYYGEYFDKLCIESFCRFNNINFFLNRDFEYKQEGRIENEQKANELSKYTKDFLIKNNIPFIELKANYDTADEIVSEVLNNLKKEDEF